MHHPTRQLHLSTTEFVLGRLPLLLFKSGYLTPFSPEGYIWSNMLPTAWQYLAEQSGQPIECIFSIVKCYKALASYTTSSIRCPFPGCMYVFGPHPDECNFEPHFMWHRVMGHTLERCYCGASPTDLSLHFVYWHFDWSVNCPFCLGDIAAVGECEAHFRTCRDLQ